MRIVYTILGTFNSGGMERVLANKANYLANNGYEIIIITTDQKDRRPYFSLHQTIQCIDLGINYTDDLNKNLVSRTLSFLKKQRQHKKLLSQKLWELSPDITISMFDNDAFFVTKIDDGSKKILEIHFSRFKRLQYGRRGLMRWIDKFRSKQDVKIASRFARFVVLTEEDKNYWGNMSNICVIPNANSFEIAASASLVDKQVLAIGRFDYQKGFDELIKVWDIAFRQNPDWKLKIYGSGPLENSLQELIDELNLNDCIALLPPTKDIISVYLSSSIVAMTSRYEGLPMVLLEAQVCGIPLVSYACKCGPRDIIEEGINGFLVECGYIERMADRLNLLMSDDLLRKQLGEGARRNSKKFAEEEIMRKWIELFKSVND